MTIDEFFAQVKANGFNGYAPGKNDTLGDRWAGKIAQVFETVANQAGLEHGECRHTIWLIWQWLYCELAGMRSRIIASPPAIRAAGRTITAAHTEKAIDLLLASEKLP